MACTGVDALSRNIAIEFSDLCGTEKGRARVETWIFVMSFVYLKRGWILIWLAELTRRSCQREKLWIVVLRFNRADDVEGTLS